ncbi:unnamed protein product [Natator depressus]
MQRAPGPRLGRGPVPPTRGSLSAGESPPSEGCKSRRAVPRVAASDAAQRDGRGWSLPSSPGSISATKSEERRPGPPWKREEGKEHRPSSGGNERVKGSRQGEELQRGKLAESCSACVGRMLPRACSQACSEGQGGWGWAKQTSGASRKRNRC